MQFEPYLDAIRELSELKGVNLYARIDLRSASVINDLLDILDGAHQRTLRKPFIEDCHYCGDVIIRRAKNSRGYYCCYLCRVANMRTYQEEWLRR